MHFYVNETEAAIRRVEHVNIRLSQLTAELTGPVPQSKEDLGSELAMVGGPSGFLPQLSNNFGELSSQLRRLEEQMDRLESVLGLDRPAPSAGKVR